MQPLAPLDLWRNSYSVLLLQVGFVFASRPFLFQMGLIQLLTAVGHFRSTAALCLRRLYLSGLIYIVAYGETKTTAEDKKRGVHILGGGFNLWKV